MLSTASLSVGFDQSCPYPLQQGVAEIAGGGFADRTTFYNVAYKNAPHAVSP